MKRIKTKQLSISLTTVRSLDARAVRGGALSQTSCGGACLCGPTGTCQPATYFPCFQLTMSCVI